MLPVFEISRDFERGFFVHIIACPLYPYIAIDFTKSMMRYICPLLHERNYTLYKCFTLTSHSSIFIMIIGTADKGAAWAFNKVTLMSIAINTIQVYWTRTSSKVSIHEGNCIY